MARGVNIDNLLVTYYGRQTKRTNMDTMLQHARMYGYRAKHLDVTRLYVTPAVEERFRLINESEQAMRRIIERYPNEEYRGILIGANLSATRRNVLNPNNIGVYTGGEQVFPRRPIYKRAEIQERTKQLNQLLDPIYPDSRKEPLQITLEKMIDLVKLTKSDTTGNGLWNDSMVITALETIKNDQRYNNTGFLVVRRNRGLTRDKDNIWYFRAVLARRALPLARMNKEYPTLFMYRQIGAREDDWDDMPFWIPVLVPADDRLVLMFNLDLERR